jgi:hypothetical protein
MLDLYSPLGLLEGVFAFVFGVDLVFGVGGLQAHIESTFCIGADLLYLE